MSGVFGQLIGQFVGENADAGAVQRGLQDLLGGQGGLGGLVQQFENGGFGEQVRSWIGSGQNLPITADELQQVLSNQQVQALVQKTGLPIEALMPMLAKILPHAVDQATPGGQVPPDAAQTAQNTDDHTDDPSPDDPSTTTG